MKILRVALGAAIWPAQCLSILLLTDYLFDNLEQDWYFRYAIIFSIPYFIFLARDLDAFFMAQRNQNNGDREEMGP